MDAFVTCIYNGLYHTGFGGRNMRDARYRESLINIANTGAKIFCFTSTSNYQILKDQFSGYANIELQIRDFNSFDFSEKIQRLKIENQGKYSDMFWTQRCVEIMWGKFFMINQVLNDHPEYTDVYWIDAGLFHNDVLSPKYFLENKKELKNAGMILFNPFFMHKLKLYAENKLVLAQQINPHNKPIECKYNEKSYEHGHGAVGGFFGGNASYMKTICTSFIQKMYRILADDELCSEESILSGVYADHSELFKPFLFQSWYHEGWAERHDPRQSTFSNLFDLIMENDLVEDGLVFCTLAAGSRFRHQSLTLIQTFLEFVKDDIKLIVFTDEPNDYKNLDPRIIIQQFEVPCIDCAFHYGIKYKVIQTAHRMFDKVNKIFYLDADCYFGRQLSRSDFADVVPGFNISLGNLSSEVVNPGIQVKYKAITSEVMASIQTRELLPTRQFRECIMLFVIGDKYIFNKFLAEWQLLYEFSRDHKLALSGEYVEITYACFRSGYPIVDIKGGNLLLNLKNNIKTIILNNPTQAIF